MASFPTHISFGIAAGILGSLAVLALTLAHGSSFIIVIAVAATVGSIMPDMDSDSGVPFHVAFGSLAVLSAALAFSSIYRETPGDWERLLAWSLGTGLFVWVIIGFIFKRFTRHRGMAHSIPAMVLAGLVTFFAASHFGFLDGEAFLLSLAMMVGFLIHLILDEIWAAVNFHGTMFIPNKALGTALKFKSDSLAVNLGVYGAILFLIAGNLGRFTLLTESFLKQVR